MIPLSEQSQSAAIYVTLVFGLLSALAVRMPANRLVERISQGVFFGLLLLVGGETVVALGMAPRLWLAAATTFCVMVLAVVWDARHHPAVRHF